MIDSHRTGSFKRVLNWFKTHMNWIQFGTRVALMLRSRAVGNSRISQQMLRCLNECGQQNIKTLPSSGRRREAALFFVIYVLLYMCCYNSFSLLFSVVFECVTIITVLHSPVKVFENRSSPVHVLCVTTN